MSRAANIAKLPELLRKLWPILDFDSNQTRRARRGL